VPAVHFWPSHAIRLSLFAHMRTVQVWENDWDASFDARGRSRKDKTNRKMLWEGESMDFLNLSFRRTLD